MALPTKLGAAASTAMGVAACGLFALVVHLERPVSAAPGSAAQTPPSAFTVCVGPDGVLRAGRQSACPSGQSSLTTMSATSEAEAQSQPSTGDTKRLAELEQRLVALRSTLFKVVDRSGRTIFAVTTSGVAMYNGNRKVAEVRAGDHAGSFHAFSTTDSVDVSMGSADLKGGMEITTRGERNMDLGAHPEGTASLRFFAPSVTGPIVGIGESKFRTGAIVVGNALGEVRASVTNQEGPGAFSIFNSQDTNVVSFRESQLKTGFLSIGDSDGREAVKMDVNENRYGAVLAGPVLGLPFVPASGLPGSYFFGCAGGPRCYGY